MKKRILKVLSGSSEKRTVLLEGESGALYRDWWGGGEAGAWKTHQKA